LNEEGAKRLVHGLMKANDIDDKSEASSSIKRLVAGTAEDVSPSPKKPKIWSIAETVASPDSSPQKSKPPTESPHHQMQQQQQQQHQGPYHFTFPPWPHMAAAAAFAGRNSLMPPPNSVAPTFPFAGMQPSPFAVPTSLPHPHQLRPEMFARNFFAPMPPTAPMMNAAAAAAGFLNGFSFGCGPPSFPFGFGMPGVGPGAMMGVPPPTSVSQQQQQQHVQHQNGGVSEVAAAQSDSAANIDQQRQESKSRQAVCTSSVSPVSSNGERRSSTSSQEPKANTS
jgi:hypothetical protein